MSLFRGKVVEPRFYLATYGDLQNAFHGSAAKACKHFRDFGLNERRKSSPVFDVKYYMEHNKDVAKAGHGSPRFAMEHWVNSGIAEGRRGSFEFSAPAYLNRYADIARHCATAANRNSCAIEHYLGSGKKEHRNGKP